MTHADKSIEKSLMITEPMPKKPTYRIIFDILGTC